MFFFFLFIIYFGENRLDKSFTKLSYSDSTMFRVVQPNINQKDKLNSSKIESNFQKIYDLSFKNKMGSLNESEQIIILWPETAIMDLNYLSSLPLYKKIQTRKTPKLVGELVVKLPHKSYHPEDPNPRRILNTIIQVTKIGFAGGDENPLTQVYYYTKAEKNMGFRGKPQSSSFCIPAQHQELIVRMFTNPPNIAAAKKEWKEVKQQWLNKT